MKATQSTILDFSELHDRYKKACERMDILQATALEGMRKVGVGCITEESKTEFANLESEITLVLARMREICDSLH